MMRSLSRLCSQLATLTILAVLTVRLLANLQFLRQARRQAQQPLTHYPLVSVLVPARNEALTITACVTSLMAQTYPNYEVIVLNDGSQDGTRAQLEQLAKRYPALRVIHADEQLPAGWNGKSYACHRLAAQARGGWLLFTDADTQHTPHSVALGVAHGLALDADLLSAFPKQETHTWSERILVSFIIDFLPLIGLNFRAISRSEGTHTAANGQYLLTQAMAYRQTGGHAAIRHETLDDFALAKSYRRHGYKVALVDGRELLSCRMYRSAQEVWTGFSRSLLHGLDNSSLNRHTLAWAIPFAWGYGALFVNPFVRLWTGQQRWLSWVTILWLAVLRGISTRYLRRPLLEVLTTPLAAWGVMALGLSALYRRWQGQKVNWKGRYYAG